jgi:HEAT repeat protein
MKRIVLGLVAAVAAWALLAPSAFAHGGQFRGPGGAVPPGLREPSDPTPPPPPPPTEPPPTTPPDTTPPSGPPPVTPPDPTTPPPPPQSNPDPETGSTRRSSSIGYENWTFWWGNNKDDILNIKESIYRLRFTDDNPLAQIGGTRGNTHDATRATEKQVKDLLIPALEWAMDHKNKQHPDTESASYLALAKVTSDPAHIRALQNGVTNDALDKIVRESAALSLGLLRRGEGRRAFDARELDRVRDFCFEAFVDDKNDTRLRSFAMLAVGLLGDQPTVRGVQTTGSGGGLFHAPDAAVQATTSARIYDLLRASYSDDGSLQTSLLLALSLQPSDTVTTAMLDTLKECTLQGRLFKADVNDTVQSYAALALGRVGTDLYIDAMLNAMAIKKTGLNTKRSAAIALGQLGRRVDGARRAEIASGLVKAIEAAKDHSTKNFGIISLAYLLEADVRAQRTDVLNAKGAKVADYIVKIAEDGNYVQRPFGALALGLVGRAIGDKAEIVAYGELREKAIQILRAGITDQKMDKRSRAGFAVGLGMLRDSGAKKELVAIVADKVEDSELRGYAAVALGMIGEPSPEVVKAIEDALHERSSEELRQQTAVALGLLGNQGAVELLLKELDEADTQNVQGQIVLALAQIGDARAIGKLVELMKNEAKPDLTRALACAGLGLIGDLEMIPSLARISKDINYRAATDAINEVLSIL